MKALPASPSLDHGVVRHKGRIPPPCRPERTLRKLAVFLEEFSATATLDSRARGSALERRLLVIGKYRPAEARCRSTWCDLAWPTGASRTTGVARRGKSSSHVTEYGFLLVAMKPTRWCIASTRLGQLALSTGIAQAAAAPLSSR